jgi:hypothetical protein
MKKAASKDRLKPKETQMPNMSLNMSRGRDLNNTSKFLFKIPSLTRPELGKKAPDYKEELARDSKQRKEAREQADNLKLENSSNGSSDLRFKLKNSKGPMKVSDIFAEDESDRAVEEWVAKTEKQKQDRPSKQRKVAAQPYSELFMTKPEESK